MAWCEGPMLKEAVILMVILLILFIIQRFLHANCELRNEKLAKRTRMTGKKPKMMATKPKMMATKIAATPLQMIAMG